MAASEFEVQAEQIGRQITTLDADRRIAAACRGSANPAALAWLAEALGLTASTSLVDLGAGLGGPLAWFRARYGCAGIAVEPSDPAIVAAGSLFGLVAVRASANAVPLRDGAVDVTLLLGVVSVVDDPTAALHEARRVSRRLGVLDYCSTRGSMFSAGGSHFPTPEHLGELLAQAGWSIEQIEHVAVDAPPRWREALAGIEVPADPAEDAVAGAIDAGAIAPFMVAAR